MTNSIYQSDIKTAAAELKTDLSAGLSSAEAATRLQTYGLNQLTQKSKINPVKLFFDQFKDFLIIILLAAAAISILLGERVDGFLIFGIVIAVALVGFLNEYKAERTIEALKRLVSLKAKLVRDGKLVEVDAKTIVPGDLILLEEGQKLPADIRLTEVIALQANEASLTGESQPVYKRIEPISQEVPLGDRLNLVFAGTTITAGKGQGIVYSTANQTEIGRIAGLVESAEDEETPMQQKLDQLGKQLGYGILAICAVVFVVIFFLDRDSASLPLARRLTFAFIAAVALAVAAIPEGLAFVVRISLALGARRMAGRKALIRRLPAVEALGSTDVICCDKTGTLTKGEMTVRELWLPGQLIALTGAGYSSQGEFKLDGRTVKPDDQQLRMLRLGALCNNSSYDPDTERIIGDPTEAALKVAAVKAGQTESDWSKANPRVGEVPFSSDRKLMSTVHRSGAGFLVATKGAAELVLDRCQSVQRGEQAEPLTEQIRAEVLAELKRMSLGALRVLALAYKETDQRPDDKEVEAGLTLVGLVGMMDPPRSEIAATIQAVTTQAGMKVIMITGDHIDTAKAVAAEVGIVGEAITGVELDKLKQSEFEKRAPDIAIYARVSPEHKIRIVQALKKAGHQVAMTGDGVNDAPAIKAADIGIAMGITGTDVAKEAADVILLDDHFLTIVNAVEEGRGIFDNIRKFVNYLLSCNLAEVLIVVAGIVFYGELALTALQLLFINIVTDGLPAVALGSDPAEKGIMAYPPSRFQGEIVNRRLWLEMAIFGTAMTFLVMLMFHFGLRHHGLEHAQSVAFTATVLLELVRLVILRSDYRIGWLSNPWLIFAMLASLGLQLMVVYSGPLSRKFDAGSIDSQGWLVIGLAAVALFIFMKTIKPFLGSQQPKAPKPTNAPAKAGLTA